MGVIITYNVKGEADDDSKVSQDNFIINLLRNQNKNINNTYKIDSISCIYVKISGSDMFLV